MIALSIVLESLPDKVPPKFQNFMKIIRYFKSETFTQTLSQLPTISNEEERFDISFC